MPSPFRAAPRFARSVALAALAAVLSFGGVAANPGAASAVADTWSPVGPPASPHGSGSTATVLANGKVLVAGGGNGQSTGAADLYDPVSGKWAPTGAMATPRLHHSATLLKDGKVLVAGGIDNSDSPTPGGYTGSAELYDPVTGSWSATGSLAKDTGTIWHTATRLRDGQVLLVGGLRPGPGGFPAINSAQLYDPGTGNWTTVAPMAIARGDHTATLLKNNKVLVAGGRDGEINPSLNTAEEFDPTTKAWQNVPRLMATPRAIHTATLLANGNVVLAGGTRRIAGGADEPGIPRILPTAELYDAKARLWRPAPELPEARVGHGAALLGDGRVLVAGGAADRNAGQAVDTAVIYDPRSNRWSPAAVPPTVGASPARLRVLDVAPCGQSCGKALLIGSASIQLYDPGKAAVDKTSSTAPKTSDSSGFPFLAVVGAAVVVVVAGGVIARQRRQPRRPTSRTSGQQERR